MHLVLVIFVSSFLHILSSITWFLHFSIFALISSNKLLFFRMCPLQVLQEVLRYYSVPDNLFGRVCIIIDKVRLMLLPDMFPIFSISCWSSFKCHVLQFLTSWIFCLHGVVFYMFAYLIKLIYRTPLLWSGYCAPLLLC